MKDVIRVAEEVTGRKIKTQMAPRRPGDPPKLVAAAKKARTVLGWKPQFADLRTIIQNAWDWHQAHPRGYSR